MNSINSPADLDRLDFTKSNGLVTVVTQDGQSRAVLMVAHADREALERTIASGEMHYRSRTRGPWRKGETSGNVQRVVALYHDCDGDAVLAIVAQSGPACHTGAATCFGKVAQQNASTDDLDRLDTTIRERASTDTGAPSYTRRLLADRNLRLKKLGEETAELVLACADEDRERAVNEGADVLYHMLVALRPLGIGIADLRSTLAERAGN